jgi:hypothetical protein
MREMFVGPALVDPAKLGLVEAKKRRSRIIAALKGKATPERQGAEVAESKSSSTATNLLSGARAVNLLGTRRVEATLDRGDR